MAAFAYSRRKPYRPHPKAAAARAATNRRRPPPSSALINAVLERAELRDDLGGGRILLRLGPSALADAGLRRSLGAEAGRMADVAVIWDEREEVVFRVLDGGPPSLAVVPTAPPSEDEHFELTPEALAYIAQSQSTRLG